MSTYENHRRAHSTLTARQICRICGVSPPILFNFCPPTYFVPHCCCGRALHAVCYRRDFFRKKVEHAELSDYGLATVMTKVTRMLYGVHGFDTMFMAHLKI